MRHTSLLKPEDRPLLLPNMFNSPNKHASVSVPKHTGAK